MIILVWLCDLCGEQLSSEVSPEKVAIRQGRHLCDACYEKADWKKPMNEWPNMRRKTDV